jgi:hypothetical protein
MTKQTTTDRTDRVTVVLMVSGGTVRVSTRYRSIVQIDNGGGRSGTPDQEVEWLTPAPDGTTVEIPWPDENGPFLLTCHLALVDGRTLLVGLDVRSFSLAADGSAVPGPAGLVEVNHPALRSLRAGEIAETARARLAAELAAQSRSRRGTARDRQAAARRSEALTTPHRSRPTGFRPASSQLQKVADLYLDAVGAGGDSARRPSIYVHHALAEQGSDITLNTVRGQIHRARVKGLIPPAAHD